MTFARLLLRNLVFHCRGNFAVLLGVVVGTAVLTGALLVGDSLRGSLRDLTLRRLGWVDNALITGRFFRADLAAGVGGTHVAPALLLQAAAARGDGSHRVNKVVLLGVDERFWHNTLVPVGAKFWRPPQPIDLRQRGVVLGAALARDLKVAKDETVAFQLEKVSAAPRESFLGKRGAEAVLTTLELKVAEVLPDDHLGSAFSLNPSPTLPRNAFVPLPVLQEELRSQEDRARSLPPLPVNALLVEGGTKESLEAKLGRLLTLDDWGLEVRTPRRFGGPAPGYLSLESRQIFVEPAAQAAVEKANLTAAPTLVYMFTNLGTVRQHALAAAGTLAPLAGPVPLAPVLAAAYGPVQAPYSVVAALDPTRPPPLGPFLPKGLDRLRDDEILLVRWDGSPFTDHVGEKPSSKGLRPTGPFVVRGLREVAPGDPLALTYFRPGEEGQLRQQTVVLRLAGTTPLEGRFRDRNLTPQVPGITDRLTLDEWEAPFPFDRARLQPADNRYWAEHRATPKAYVTLKTGQKLWGGRFGDVTSIRLVPPAGDDPAQVAAEQILANLRPAQGGFVFEDVRRQRLEASAGGIDFGGLFLGFSCFLILAALLLVGLLFRLNIDRRAREVGLLLAAGFRRGTVRGLFLTEGGVLAALGGLVGLAGAVLYAWLMLEFLAARWPGGLDRSFLRLHVGPLSLLYGYVGAVAVSLLTIVWATRTLARVAPRALLLGETAEGAAVVAAGPRRWSRWVAGVGLVGTVICLVIGTQVRDHEAQAGSFFGSGALLLAAGLALFWGWMRRDRREVVHGSGAPALARLAMRNASRHPVRSLLTVGLLAAATFLVVAVQVFHREPGADFLTRAGGSGGFPLLAEVEVPVYQDLNSDRGRADLNLSPPTAAALRDVRFVPLRLRAGDDASCLNLYQPRRPRLLGVPSSLIERGGFQFAGTEARTDEERRNPWLLLRGQRADGAIPVLGEANTVVWMLGSNLGGEISVPDARGRPVKLRVVGLLKDSIFPSELLMSEENFLATYPRQEGYAFFLIDPPAGQTEAARAAVEKALAGHGVAVTPAVARLEAVLAVENTYLATFQALGGLGLLLGALGLAVVLLRSVWERRGELALFRALGYRRAALGWLVLAENGYLLILGALLGVAAAFWSVLPQLLGGAGAVHVGELLGVFALVTVVGLAAGAAALAATLRAPLLPALRRE